MIEAEAVQTGEEEEPPGPPARRWPLVLGIVAGIVALALALVWLTRERIADNVIAGQLDRLGLPATYTIESIGPREQVLRDIVVGDPNNPDLTIERAVVAVSPRLGLPAIGRITLVKPRLYGTVRQGKASFGSLDKVLFGGPKGQAFRMPDLDLAIADGRARIVTDQGQVGLKLDGAGPLRGGFKGIVAAIAPRLTMPGCTAERASIYGALSITSEKPRLVGPARLGALDCPAKGLALRSVGLDLDAVLDARLDGGTAKGGIATGLLRAADARANGLNGTVDLTYRSGALTARYDIIGRGLAHPQASAATLSAKGTLRGADGLNRIDSEGTLDGGGVRLGQGLDAALASAAKAGQGSLIEPLLAQMRSALAREGRNSRLGGDYILRRTGAITNVVVPQMRLRGGSGDTLLAVSSLQFVSGGAAAPRLAGNFSTGGAGLPRIVGRMERTGGGGTLVRMAMAEYRAGNAQLALPELVLAQTSGGALGFSGRALASGPLPGGEAQNLALPLDGNWAPGGALALWRGCRTIGFDRLSYAQLTLERRSLQLCPGAGGAIVRSTSSGIAINAGASSLDLTGRLGDTPIRIASGPVGFASPGALFAKTLDVTLGPPETATRLKLADLTAKVGKDIAGKFAGTDATLAAVPLDILGATGDWRYADGKLSVSGGAFRLEDRTNPDRFAPMIARDATLTLADNRIDAFATLREPRSDRAVTTVTIRHDLSTARGHADLAVAGLTFDGALQPDSLTPLALGVVANVAGTVRGSGDIDWTASSVTSTGRFSTDSLDLAAAFGPAKGISGTVEFTDLINLVTAPNQRLKVASINPGIEVNDGTVLFRLRPGNILTVEGATWPFMGGTLTLRPVDMRVGVAETRRYVLDIDGLDAAKFIERMELANFGASGTFDGSLPLVFTEQGGRIEGGLLTARPPGGHVSYIGALSYENMGAIANFAFDALKDLDYRAMTIAMDGAIAGDIVTRVRFDGVKQGATAKRNFITRRFEKLPIQFNVNINAPFYQLITSFKAFNDPAFVRDPRELGLIDENFRPLAPEGIRATAPNPPISDIQPSDSRKTP